MEKDKKFDTGDSVQGAAVETVHVVADSDTEDEVEVLDLTVADQNEYNNLNSSSPPTSHHLSMQSNASFRKTHSTAMPMPMPMPMPISVPIKFEETTIPQSVVTSSLPRRRSSRRQRQSAPSIEPTTSAAASAPPAAAPIPKTHTSFFDTSLGNLLLDIGEGLVHEAVQTDLLRNLKCTVRKCDENEKPEITKNIEQLNMELESSAEKNKIFKFKMKKCEFCNFKSDSMLVLANHYETPHIIGSMYKCNFCNFSVRSASSITNHMLLVHKVAARLEKPLSNNQCPNCPYEDNGKARLLRHLPNCAKRFSVENNQSPPFDWQPPAMLPDITRAPTQDTNADSYQALFSEAATQIAEFANLKRQQIEQLATMTAQNELLRGRPVSKLTSTEPSNNNELNTYMPANFLPNKRATDAEPPSVSIFPIQKPTSSGNGTSSQPTTSSATLSLVPSTKPSAVAPAAFVLNNCEICDMPIRNMEQLRKHMLRTHSVRIHPKCLRTQPPLGCLKCPYRCYSDQGLEAHLLCIHGLVTTSLQAAAAASQDKGRCLLCGRQFSAQFVTHVIKEHGMNLRPAHLQYTCPVCPAAFQLYKDFDDHARIAHRDGSGLNTNTKPPPPQKSNNTNPKPVAPPEPIDLSNKVIIDMVTDDSEGSTYKNRLLLENLERNNQITIIRKYGPLEK